MKKLFIILISAVILLLIVLLIAALDSRLLIRRYAVESEKISSPVRIVLVTDLHSCRYGEDQAELIEAIDAQSPDVILLGGDIFDDENADTGTELFLAGIAGRYPIYYVTGNHECWSGISAFGVKMSVLEKYGITVLSGETVTLNINGETLNLCGVDDPDVYMVNYDFGSEPREYEKAKADKENTFLGQLKTVSCEASDGGFTVLLSHRPEYYGVYGEYDFDLVLCGHAHGGQWRIPGILNGLYAPNQGVFPKYAGGRYDGGDMTMIVSRGLARETTAVPRIFNRPELVVIDIE